MQLHQPAEPPDSTENLVPQPPENTPQLPPIHPDALLRAGAILGVVLIGLAWFWVDVVRQGHLLDEFPPAEVWHLLPGIIVGATFAVIIWSIGRSVSAMQRIAAMIARTINLNKTTLGHVLAFSVLAALPEEVFFRGALQTEFGITNAVVGLLLASLIFGALHALTPLYFAYATGAGLLLGSLYLLSGSLWLAVGTHFAIDVVMFIALLHRHNHVID